MMVEHQIAIIRLASKVDWMMDAEFREFAEEVSSAIDVGALDEILRRWRIAFTPNRLIDMGER